MSERDQRDAGDEVPERDRNPFEADRFVDGFVEVERAIHFVDPDSPLGRAMARARETWGLSGPPDPDDFDWESVRPSPVDDP